MELGGGDLAALDQARRLLGRQAKRVDHDAPPQAGTHDLLPAIERSEEKRTRG